MTFFDWVRIAGGVAGLWLTYTERRKNPQKKAWILLLIGSIGFILAGIVHL